MANAPEVYWTGNSGTQYRYWVYPIGTELADKPGNYIYAGTSADGKRWTALYVGETNSLERRLSNHEKEDCVKRHGATHIHAHASSSDERARRAEESDLLANRNPPCNN